MFDTDTTETVTGVNDGATIVETTKDHFQMNKQELSEKLAKAVEACIQKDDGKINLGQYEFQTHTDENGDLFKFNTGSMSPLDAMRLQLDLKSRKNNRRIVYQSPTGKSVLLLVTERAFQLLATLADGKWHKTASLKTLVSETRKPISDLRACGLVIGTKGRSEYRLFGIVTLYPLGPCLSVPRLGDILPDIVTATKIEHEKARRDIAKRIGRANKTAANLEKNDGLDK